MFWRHCSHLYARCAGLVAPACSLSGHQRIKLDSTSDSQPRSQSPQSFWRCDFLSEGVTKPCATVSHPTASARSCQGGARIRNPVVFSFLPPPPPSPHPSLPLSLTSYLSGCGASRFDEWGVFALMSKCAALAHGAREEKWQDAALSPRLSTDGQTPKACVDVTHTGL